MNIATKFEIGDDVWIYPHVRRETIGSVFIDEHGDVGYMGRRFAWDDSSWWAYEDNCFISKAEAKQFKGHF